MTEMFKKNSCKWSVVAVVIMVVVGFAGLTGARGTANAGSNGKTNMVSSKQPAGTSAESKDEQDAPKNSEVDLVPSSAPEFITKPQVEVPVNLEIEEFEQQQVDEGHKPWRLDPIQTAMTFVSLQVSPEGIEGPFPIQEKDLKIIQQTNKVAVVEVSGDKTPTTRVYMKRLIRQDDAGIWSVVGYDPVR